MENVLAGLPWDGISTTGVLLLIVVAFLRGWIKTGRDYDDQVARADKAEEKVRYWQNVAEQRSRQVDTLLPTLDTATKFIEATVKARGVTDGEA